MLVSLVASACLVRQDEPYPAAWPSLSTTGTSEGCHDLDGVYADHGETHAFPAVTASLTFNLGWQAWGPAEDQKQGWRDANRVTLTVLDSNSMEAVIWGVNAVQLARHILTHDSGEFVCEQGHATIRWHVYGAEDVVAARDDYTVELRRAGEYLVAHIRDRGIGVIGLFFPVAGRNSGWVRFERLAKEDSSRSPARSRPALEALEGMPRVVEHRLE